MARPSHPPSPAALQATEALGALIATARKRRRLTQAQLGQRAGVGRVTVAKAEAGHPGLTLATLLELLLVLDPAMVGGLLAAVARDPLGETLERQRLPLRVRVTDEV